MNNTIYIADTCGLREENARKELHAILQADSRNRLLILASVREELERQVREKNEQESADALHFLQQEYLSIIFLPESDNYPKESVADNEILYFCYTHRQNPIILYTQDGPLTQTILQLLPHVQVRRSEDLCMITKPEPLHQQWDELLLPYSSIFCTAAAINSAARNGSDKFLFSGGKVILSVLSLPGLTLQAHESIQKYRQHLTWVSPANHNITECEELSIRLLTHRHKNKMVLLLLAEEEDTSSYLRHGQCLPCSQNRGFAVAALSKGGTIRILAPSPRQPKELSPAESSKEETNTPPPIKESNSPTGKKNSANAPVSTGTQKEKSQQEKQKPTETKQPALSAQKQLLKEYILKKKTMTAAGNMMATNPALVYFGIYYSLTEAPEKLNAVCSSLEKRGLSAPAKNFEVYVSNIIPKKKNALLQHLKDIRIQLGVKKLLKVSKELNKVQATMDKLLALENKGAEIAPFIHSLIETAMNYGAPAPKNAQE